MKIALVVPGRFHAFDLARALLTRGHDVTVLTNYPAWAARRFGMPDGHLRSFTLHGMLTRLINVIDRPAIAQRFHPVSHRMFGRWATRVLMSERWDVIHCWSGVSEEILTSPAARDALTLLMRGSTHIATQRRLLDEESARVSRVIDQPSDWTVARETREYALADHIAVLSTFALSSFEQEGLSSERVSLLPLGVDIDVFKATPEAIEERRRRILSGQPLRVLYSGAVSYRKGLRDLASTITRLATGNFKFTLAGEITPEAGDLIASLGARVEILGKLPQAKLPLAYQAADVFLFPTIEDGFALVLAQAKAAGLPIITTPNSAGPDLLLQNRDGWIVPIRDPEAIMRRLRWCDANREELADMVTRVNCAALRGWSDVAQDFERVCAKGSSVQLPKVRTHVC